MSALFTFEAHTPYRLFYADEVEAIVLTLSDGEAAVYANHLPFTAPVISCQLKIKDKDGNWKTAFTAEGILEVKKSKTVLLTDAAEWPSEIDRERAREAKTRAEEMLTEGILTFDRETALASLRRASTRLKVSELSRS